MIAKSRSVALLLAGISLLVGGVSGAFAQQTGALRSRLAEALIRGDPQAVQSCVDEGKAALGAQVGEPEVRDHFDPIPQGEAWLTPREVRGMVRQGERWLERHADWKIGMDPATLKQPLRAVASHLRACLSFARIDPGRATESLEWARRDAAFLMWSQEQGGAGLFPFPAVRGGTGGAFEAAEKFLARASKDGRLADVVRNGWLVRDDGDGGLQFDNGECGMALLAIYTSTREVRYLNSAQRAIEWAIDCPLVPNWNYNSFSVSLLARAYAVTTNEAWLSAATRKALVGVIPGQVNEGWHRGRWMDPHNARPAYHYILVRSLAELVLAMPKDDPARPRVLEALVLGLRARNPDFLGPGAPNRDKAIEALLLARRALREDAGALQTSQTQEALNALASLISGEARRGRNPVGPSEWAVFLEETLFYAAPAGSPNSAPSIPNVRR